MEERSQDSPRERQASEWIVPVRAISRHEEVVLILVKYQARHFIIETRIKLIAR
jgi:hypothetical protein